MMLVSEVLDSEVVSSERMSMIHDYWTVKLRKEWTEAKLQVRVRIQQASTKVETYPNVASYWRVRLTST